MKRTRLEIRRNKILNAALDIVASKGVFAATVSEMAKVLNIGHGTFYRYFANKSEIFSTLIAMTTDRIVRSLEEQVPPTANSLEEYRQQLKEIGQLFSRYFSMIRDF